MSGWRAYTATLGRVLTGEMFVAELKFPPFGLVYHATLRLWGVALPEPAGPLASHGRAAAAKLEELLAGKTLELSVCANEQSPGRFWCIPLAVDASAEEPIDVPGKLLELGYAKNWFDGYPRPTFDPDAPYPLPGAGPT